MTQQSTFSRFRDALATFFGYAPLAIEGLLSRRLEG